MRPRLSRTYPCLIFALSFAALLFVTPASAQESQHPWSTRTGEDREITPVIVHLVDESVVRGELVSLDEDHVVVDSKSLGRVTIAKRFVRSIEYPEDSTEVDAKQIWKRAENDYNSVMLGPTPETLPARTAYFRNFELFILNFGYAITDDLNVSFGMLFPVSSSFQMVSLGFKYRIVSREDFPFGFAVAATGSLIDETSFATVSGIAGIGNRHRSLNLSVHQPFVENNSDAPAFFIVSGDLQVAGSVKLLGEYGNSGDAVFSDEDFSGFMNVGLRIFGDSSSFSLTGFRPLTIDDADGFIAFPLAMYSRTW